MYGLRASFLVGALGGCVAAIIGMAVGFTAGYRGGAIDELLSMLTNVVLVIPTLAVLIIVAAYLTVKGLVSEALLIGVTSWPWAARAIRAQTFSLASRDFVSLARLSGARSGQVIVQGDRPEHELVPVPHVHPPLRRRDPHRRHARLPRARPVERDVARPDDEQRSRLRSAPAGDVVVVHPARSRDHCIVGGLYVTNVGLDEIFNPKLRKT